MAKMTKREMFCEIRKAVIDNEEMVAFIDKEIGLLDKKRSTPRKPSDRQVENESLKESILSYLMESDAPKCIKEMQTEIPKLEGLSSQRISALLQQMVKAETIVKTYEKKVAYFSYVG